MEDAKRSKAHFRLRPFTSAPSMEQLSISGALTRTSGSLLVEFRVEGAVECIDRPSISPVPSRCHELWRHTCFELFFGIKGESGYWEVNLCLSGCWNVYCFDGYRTGMQEEDAVGQPHCCVVTDSDLLSLNCCLDLKGIVADSSELDVGVGSVIKTTDGSIGYWAIVHHGQKPDFHNRQSFLVSLS